MNSLAAVISEDISFNNVETIIERHAYLVSECPSSPSPAPVGGSIKRVIDIMIAGTTLFLLAPIMLMVAALIYLTQGGSVVFAQPRVGFGRNMFRCFKFRTMVPDAEERLAAHLAANPEAAREWQETQKLKNDPRVTWLGRFLRKSSIDELPQLINVLRGEMSCIGPRPIVANELSRYGDYAEEYAMTRPGLTGIWQVSGRSNTTYTQRVQMDRYYARRWSLMLDLKILFLTVPALVKISQTA
jgi:exopolysaccharide production protein ExoY